MKPPTAAQELKKYCVVTAEWAGWLTCVKKEVVLSFLAARVQDSVTARRTRNPPNGTRVSRSARSGELGWGHNILKENLGRLQRGEALLNELSTAQLSVSV